MKKIGTMIFRYHIIKSVAEQVRKDLSEKYDVEKGEYKNFRGLCDEAVKLFKDYFSAYTSSENYSIDIHHGEQKHTPKILSKYWMYQHTWLSISFNDNNTFYVDITQSQFKYLYPEALDVYVSSTEPEMYLDDRENITIKLWKKHKKLSKIYEKFEYKIKAPVYDMIHNIFYNKERRIKNENNI